MLSQTTRIDCLKYVNVQTEECYEVESPLTYACPLSTYFRSYDTVRTVVIPRMHSSQKAQCSESLEEKRLSPSSKTMAGARKIPCKARGLNDEDHNVTNAYFVIHADMKHGQLIVCSHKPCVDSGRKFRYCAVCDAVVAKRMFQKRHSHGLVPPFPLGIVDPSLYSETFEKQTHSISMDQQEDTSSPPHRRQKFEQQHHQRQWNSLPTTYNVNQFSPTNALPPISSSLSNTSLAYNPLFSGSALFSATKVVQQEQNARIESHRMYNIGNDNLAIRMLQDNYQLQQQRNSPGLPDFVLPHKLTAQKEISPPASLVPLSLHRPRSSQLKGDPSKARGILRDDSPFSSSPEDTKPTAKRSQEYEIQTWGEDDFDDIFNDEEV